MYYVIAFAERDGVLTYWRDFGGTYWTNSKQQARWYTSYNDVLYRCKWINAKRPYYALCEVITCNS